MSRVAGSERSIPSVEKGFRDSMHRAGRGYEVIGVNMIRRTVRNHDVDSSDMAFQICARDLLPRNLPEAPTGPPRPIMKVEVESRSSSRVRYRSSSSKRG